LTVFLDFAALRPDYPLLGEYQRKSGRGVVSVVIDARNVKFLSYKDWGQKSEMIVMIHTVAA
jgi:hypothetical protein